MQSSKNYIITFIIFSAGYILLGLLLILAPETSQQLICYLLGSVAVVLGIGRIIYHFTLKDMSRAFRSDIPLGVMLILGGIYLMVRSEMVWEWLPVLLGFAIVFDSILKLQHAFDLRRAGFGYWWGGLGLSIITAILGILLVLGVFRGNALMVYFGTVLIIDGVVNIVTIILVMVQTKRFEKRRAEAEARQNDPSSGATP